MKLGQFSLVALLLSFMVMIFSLPASAQLGGLKNKVKEKVTKKAEDKADKKSDEAADKQAGSEDTTVKANDAKGNVSTTEEMKLYTKYDFVPGDKVIFYDDVAGDEIGEFPSRWNLDHGVFEVVKQGDEKWIMCTDKGVIKPKIKTGPLPPKYTVEMEIYNKGGDAKSHWYYIEWVDSEGQMIGQLAIKDAHSTYLTINGKDIASKELPAPLSTGKHTMRIMATKTTLKCYIDNERVANVPSVEGFDPVGFQITMDPWLDEENNPMLVRGFRYAEGGKTLKEQLDESGKIITHGILFDSGSDRIKGESYKTLADIGQLLTDNPALHLSIEGHTDSDGTDDANIKLSHARATAVKVYLINTYKIDGSRLDTKGWGESKPIDTNTTAEGKANNRRVELVKL
jgi:outer membrane protein OmpA-like peptidoglycan-associated protein